MLFSNQPMPSNPPEGAWGKVPGFEASNVAASQSRAQGSHWVSPKAMLRAHAANSPHYGSAIWGWCSGGVRRGRAFSGLHPAWNCCASQWARRLPLAFCIQGHTSTIGSRLHWSTGWVAILLWNSPLGAWEVCRENVPAIKPIITCRRYRSVVSRFSW